MKYIKLLDKYKTSTNREDIKKLYNLKKYLIIKGPSNNNMYLCKFDLYYINFNYNYDTIEAEVLYKYENNIIEKEKNRNRICTFFLNGEDYQLSIIEYSSDKLKDCMEMLPVLISTNKFNL